MARPQLTDAEMRPLFPFRVHYDAPFSSPIDVNACDAAEARKLALAQRPGIILKIKIVREQI